ncbi:hypothetical protein [Rhodoferax aquaticus]|nr:hypothetical protein [Rhodoferax aquaticus]
MWKAMVPELVVTDVEASMAFSLVEGFTRPGTSLIRAVEALSERSKP